MYILIEHNGTEEHQKYVNIIQTKLEADWGATVEQVIGNNEKEITLYTEELKRLTSLQYNDDLDVLDFYIKHYYEDEL